MDDIFSVIVLLYNNSEYLRDCLDSILMQDYPRIEVIVVDDCSNSFNKDAVVSYLEDHKRANLVNYIVYKSQSNTNIDKSFQDIYRIVLFFIGNCN